MRHRPPSVRATAGAVEAATRRGSRGCGVAVSPRRGAVARPGGHQPPPQLPPGTPLERRFACTRARVLWRVDANRYMATVSAHSPRGVPSSGREPLRNGGFCAVAHRGGARVDANRGCGRPPEPAEAGFGHRREAPPTTAARPSLQPPPGGCNRQAATTGNLPSPPSPPPPQPGGRDHRKAATAGPASARQKPPPAPGHHRRPGQRPAEAATGARPPPPARPAEATATTGRPPPHGGSLTTGG
jgi:hypothetical protein